MRETLEALRLARLTRQDLILVAFLVTLLGGVVVLWQGYQGVREERETVERSVKTQVTRVERLRALPAIESLRQELGDLEAKLSSPEALFPKSVETVDLTNLFLQAGQKNGVELVGVQRTDNGFETLAKTVYQGVKYAVQAQAPLGNISGFLKDVEEGGFVTLRAEGLNLSRGKEARETWDVRFNVVVLAQAEPTPTPSR